MSTKGWFGNRSQLLHFLRTVGADTDDEGNFLIGGPPEAAPVSFMGSSNPNTDVVIPGEAVYFKSGQASNLANGLGATSYGMSITVI